MGLAQQVASIFQREVNSANIKIQRWPNAAAGVAIVAGATPAFSAWTQLLAAAKITDPSWLTAVFLEHEADAGAAEVWLVDLATGAAGVEVSLSSGANAAQGIYTVTEVFDTAVGLAFSPPYNLPFPIKIAGAPRISAALAGLVTGGKTAFVAFQTATGVGT